MPLRLLIASALTLALVAAISVVPVLRAASEDGAAAQRPALTVTIAQPQTQPMRVSLQANGNIMAWQEASIGAEIGGLRLQEVLVNVGDAVKAGQTLATFASETVRADIAQARAALAEAEASAAEARANAERAMSLKASGALSEAQINQYVTGGQTARARVESARASLASQELRLKFTQVKAPDSGVISSRTATVGAVVNPGTELFRMIRKGRLEWRGEVTSAEVGRIRVGGPVTVVAASGERLQGKVRTIGPTVDPQTRNTLVYVDLPGASAAGSSAKAGMFARGEFELGNAQAMTVPQQAVVMREAFNYVFVVGPDNRVAQRKVQTGRRDGDRVEILEGLKPDERVAVRGAGFLTDGDLVRIVEAPAPAATPATAITR
ncbi:MAG: efflux RND transporter periplasmic adaptor subunit [Pigmentiphaga sp.]|uniref:efflux RND transporter periplasmic adaptor subunit n=1 Tax=Pigmentiphaga sp. TaxID=1977564 RepID=UPI0029B179A6|nr:efflux RND transporter periplasmic adaptor subunit [Pigmentiphaga sp.]MDX3904860.1 efflux RND transporter periplasmic adaptor subunit [Pigmentiphaga sp.]